MYIDCHNDTILKLVYAHADFTGGSPELQIDLPKIESVSDLGALFFGAWSDPVFEGERALENSVELLRGIKSLAIENSDHIEIAFTAGDVESIARKDKVAIVLAVEGGHPVNDEVLADVAAVLQIRLKTLVDAPDIAGFFFKDEVHPEPESLIGKNMTAAESLEMAKTILALVESLPDFSEETANQPLRDLATDLGLKAGHVFGFLRNALTAQKISPPIFDTMSIIGREKVLERIQNGINLLENLAAI